MALINIVQDAADEIGVPQPATVAENSDPDAQKFLRLLNKSGKKLSKVAVWQDLRKERTFTSIDGETQTGILPDDFDRFVPETFWDRSNAKFISGPVSAVEWQGFKANGYDQLYRKFIYRGGDVSILPAYSAGSTLAFEYASKHWCQSSGGDGQTKFEADTDTGILDEEMLTLALIYTYLEAEGLPTAMAARDFEDYSNTLLGNDQANAGILTVADVFGNGRHFSGTPAVSNVTSNF